MCIAKQVQHRSLATSRGFVESIPRNTISLQRRYRKKDVTDKQSRHGSFNLQPTCKLRRANITAGPLHEEFDRIQLAFATLGSGGSGMRVDCTYMLQKCKMHARQAAVLHLQ
jgi:hypothetical protein